eukprot:5190027-Prymnesium_polylepis.1
MSLVSAVARSAWVGFTCSVLLRARPCLCACVWSPRVQLYTPRDTNGWCSAARTTGVRRTARGAVVARRRGAQRQSASECVRVCQSASGASGASGASECVRA